jgi:hypothetical protein
MTWPQARLLALAGTRIRREGWLDRWLSRIGHFWWITPITDLETRSEGPLFVVTSPEFTAAEFTATDWTDTEPPFVPRPPVESITLTVAGVIDDDWSITAEGIPIYTPRHLAELWSMNPRVTVITHDQAAQYGVILAIGQNVAIQTANFDGPWNSGAWTAVVQFAGGQSYTASGGVTASGNDGSIPSPIYRDCGSFVIGLPV